MRAYREGEEGAFDRLFAALGPSVHGFFLRSFQSEAVADDLLQTTFLKLHRARASYRGDLRLRPWLFAIAARVRLDEYRQRKRISEELTEEALASAEEREAPGGPDLRAESGDLVDRVRAAVDALPESQRVIVHLHRYEGLTFVEIAAVLGTSEGAVKLRAFRAYGRLRKQLAPLVSGNAPP
jgi:RNA polymerase sigma-70 factor (ECF subfamily)